MWQWFPGKSRTCTSVYFPELSPKGSIKDTEDRLERAKFREDLCPLSQVAPREVARPQSEVYHRMDLVCKQVLFGKHKIFKQFDFE